MKPTLALSRGLHIVWIDYISREGYRKYFCQAQKNQRLRRSMAEVKRLRSEIESVCIIRFVSMTSLCLTAAPDCRTKQSKGRYCMRAFNPSGCHRAEVLASPVTEIRHHFWKKNPIWVFWNILKSRQVLKDWFMRASIFNHTFLFRIFCQIDFP